MDIEKLDKKFDELGSSLGKKVKYEFHQKTTLRKRHISKTMIIIAAVVFIGISTFIVAAGVTRFQALKALSDGYKERAALIGISNPTIEKIITANKGSDQLLSVDEIPGLKNEAEFTDGSHYEKKELLSYEDFINKYSEFDYDPTISKDRMVWIIVLHYPNGIILSSENPTLEWKLGAKPRKIENAMSIGCIDAETGISYGGAITTWRQI